MGIVAFVCACTSVSASPAATQSVQARHIIVHLQEVFSAKISLMPFKGLKTIAPIAEVTDVRNGHSAKLDIPAEYLPGEFVLRIDYRTKETDTPYPSERIIFINKQDIEITTNPPYINNDEKTTFNAGEQENTAYSAFMKENTARRMPIDLLRQFLLSYDRPQSDCYAQAVTEYEQRRAEYNAWLIDQSKKYAKLYVSHLFRFHYIPSTQWTGDEKARVNQLLQNYFEGIDFRDPWIIRSREMAQFMDTYMGLYGMQATSEELRDRLFTQAGSVACEQASKGLPEVYGWMVDYFYTGYETYSIKGGMEMLQKHIDNPNCLTAKKQQISERLESSKRLVPGVAAPDFTLIDAAGENFQFRAWKGRTRNKLIVFWTTNCLDCMRLVDDLRQWYNQAANKKLVDIVAVNVDEPEIGKEKWEKAILPVSSWKHLQAQQGVNSPVARAYAILSTPVMFLVDSRSNAIVAVPEDLQQLINGLEKQ